MHHSLWLTEPAMLHSSREDSCSMTPEQCEYRGGHWRYWYIADWVYGHNTIHFFCATIAAFSIGFWALKLSPAGVRKTAWWRRLVASVRYVAYQRYEVKSLRWTTPSVGVMALLAIGTIFFFAMTLGPRPYYWNNTRTVSFGGSPPIATRSGWMAIACMPFMLILGSKANAIATMTGVSHESLMIFHSWVGYAMFVLALIHTFPFIVYHIWLGDMVELWETSIYYWTGVGALILQAYLTFMSIPWIRNAYYEFFKATHYIVALLFVLLFFFHCNFRLSSWDYFIASGVLYFSSLLYSQLRTYVAHGISRRATITNLAGGMMKISIPTSKLTWRPAQHMFLRFLTPDVHALTSHPFTICSIPSPSGKSQENALTFYVAARGGMTGRLASSASKIPSFSVPVLLEGPYGGVSGRPLTSYDRSVVVACGSGAGFSLPFIMSQLVGREGAAGHKMQVIIATRNPAMTEWYEGALVDFLEENNLPTTLDGIEITIHVTGSSEVSLPPSGDDEEKRIEKDNVQPKDDARRLPIQTAQGRPDIQSIIRRTIEEPGVSVGMAVCGPESLMTVVQNEAASGQKGILNGGSGAREIYLHSEHFTW